MLCVEVAPFDSFKQKIRLVKEYKKLNCKITIFSNYIVVEKFNTIWRDGHVINS